MTRTEPTGDLSTGEIEDLRRALAAFPRLPFVLDERQGGDEDGPDGTTYIEGILVHSYPDSISRGADEFEEIGGLADDHANRLVVAAINALPRMLRELDRRRAQDARLAPFNAADVNLVDFIASVINVADRTQYRAACPKCSRSKRTCNKHLAEGIIDAVRNQRIVMVTADVADGIVNELHERIEQAEQSLAGGRC